MERRRSITLEHINAGSENQPQSRTNLVIPSVNPKISQPIKTAASNRASKVNDEKSSRSSTDNDVEIVEISSSISSSNRGTKRKSGKAITSNRIQYLILCLIT